MGDIMDINLLNLEDSKKELLKLREENLISKGKLSAYQIFVHCAKTIEYSMIGYPKIKSKFIQHTAGKLMIHKFLKKGYMRHNLEVDVLGSSLIEDNGTTDEGIEILLETIRKFLTYKGRLQPHFFFGELTKEEYDKYFSIHIANHLSGLIKGE